MRPIVKTLSTACASALLFACADLGHRGELPAPPAAQAGSADDAYILGRQQHMANRYPAAIDNYHAALRADPRHVNATNGLATLYAEQGNLTKAIALWRDLTSSPAAAAGPGTAFLFSNLGYAHLLNGDYREAVAALERACVLDPLNHRAWSHLGSALEKLGQRERAQLMARQASALEQHDFKSDYTLAKQPAGAAIDSAVAAQDSLAKTEVRQTGNGMFELRRSAPPPAAPEPEATALTTLPVSAPDAVAVETVETAPEEARLEIRNGNGVAGMARSLAQKMDDPRMRVVRLSNHKGFNVEHTRVEYQGGFREAAERLAERFGGADLREADTGAAADVRLVIGRDLVRSKAEARRIIKAALARAARAS
jgi:Flp pilus assembly protein TadD